MAGAADNVDGITSTNTSDSDRGLHVIRWRRAIAAFRRDIAEHKALKRPVR